MPLNININIDHQKDRSDQQLIYIFFVKGTRIKISAGQRVDPAKWDEKTKSVKRSHSSYKLLNRKLKSQKIEIINTIFDLEFKKKPLTKKNIQENLSWVKNAIKGDITPTDLLQKYIDSVKVDKAVRTAKSYKTLLKCLTKMEISRNAKLSFYEFDENFYKELRTFINKHDSTFGAYIKNFKAFLNWATDKGYNSNLIFKKWKITNEDGKAHFFLKFNEVQTIANYEYEKRLDQVRDLFLIGCYCGLRYSDIITLKPQHVQDGLINKIARKTNGYLKIPVIPQLQILLDKYWQQGKDLPKITNQKGNEYIKELVEKAGINRPFNYVQIKNRVVTETTFEAWEKVTWHVARYTFITNCIQLNIPENTVMQFVGHKDYKTLKKYIQNDTTHSEIEIMKLSEKYKTENV